MRMFLKISAALLSFIMIISLISCKENETIDMETNRPTEIVSNSSEIAITRLPGAYVQYEYENVNDWTSYIKNEFNIEIELNIIGDIHVGNIVGGKYLPEAIKNNEIMGLIELSGYQIAHMEALKEENLIIPLDDFLNDNFNYQGLSASVKESYMSPDGQTWAIPVMDSWGIFSRKFRTEWLEKLELSVPTNLNELYAVGREFAYNDPNGNGLSDEHGIDMSYAVGARHLNDIFIANECYLSNISACSIAYNHKTGTYEDALLHPGMKESLLFIKSLVEDGILHANVDFQFLGNKYSGCFYDLYHYFQGGVNYSEWSEVTNLTGDKEKSIMAFRPYKAYVLTSNTENPKETINEFVNIFLSSIKGMAIGTYGIENINYQLSDDKLEAISEERIDLIGVNYEMLLSNGIVLTDLYEPDYNKEYRAKSVEQFNSLYNDNLIFWDSYTTLKGNREVSSAFGNAISAWLDADNMISVDDFLANLIKSAKIYGNPDVLRELNSEIEQTAKYKYD